MIFSYDCCGALYCDLDGNWRVAMYHRGNIFTVFSDWPNGQEATGDWLLGYEVILSFYQTLLHFLATIAVTYSRPSGPLIWSQGLGQLAGLNILPLDQKSDAQPTELS